MGGGGEFGETDRGEVREREREGERGERERERERELELERENFNSQRIVVLGPFGPI